MGRILAIDFGLKRIGLAVTDILQITTNPLDTVSPENILEYLKKYCSTEPVETIVIGYPTRADGSDTNSTPHIRKFVKVLEKEFPQIPLYLQDESYSSATAMQAMVAGGMKKKDRRKKENLDKVSAAVILRAYLESK